MGGYRPVTLADIAEVAQVSISTVSRILKQREGDIKISQTTRERVLQVARELGYEPNPFASALRTQRTGVFGVVVRDIGDPFLSLLVRTLQRAAHEAGFEVLIGHAEKDYETAESQLHVMVSHWFDGLFLLGNVPGDQSLVQALLQRRIPFVGLACGMVQENAPLVSVDDLEGTRLALTHLTQLGHRHIAFLGDVIHVGVQDRFLCFQEYMREHALTSLCYEHVGTRSAAVEAVGQLLDLPDPPTALFCASDMLVPGVLAGVWQRGKRVPDDLSIVGFDDIEEARELYPPLTTVRQPVGEMSREAIQLLRSFIDDGLPVQQQRRILPPILIERLSCAPL